MRRPLRWLAVVLMAGVAVLGWLVAPACACSCAAATDPEYLQRAELAFEGVAIDVDEPFLPTSSATPVTVRFRVESVAKGEPGDRVTLRTARDEASCGYAFEPGHRYRVYAVGELTSACSGNRDLGAAPDVPLEEGWPWTLMGIAAVAALVAVGVLALRRGRGMHRF